MYIIPINNSHIPLDNTTSTCYYHRMKPQTNLNPAIYAAISAGDRVTILIPNGIGRNGVEWREKTGRAVMRGTHGWVLNMGGPHGTPGIAGPDNTVSVCKARKVVA